MKQLLTSAGFAAMLLLCVVFCQSCNGQQIKRAKDGLEIATVKDMVTHIPVPESQRKHFGYDSIQLLVDSGKITANFCYPNHWLYAKDTVYTGDSAYRLWGFQVKLTPEMYITMRDTKHTMTMRSGFWDMTKPNWNCDSVIIDSFKIKITKVVPDVK